ncbi:MAG: SPOR domain-containing protein [Hyphomicrobium sp.]
MSRSNGSQPLPAGQTPQASGYDINPDPRAWTAPQNAAQQPAAASYQQAPQQRPIASTGQTYAQPAQGGYADPYGQHGGYYQAQQGQAPAQTYSAPQAATRPAGQPAASASYAPKFDPYVPAQGYQPSTAQPAAAAYPDLRGSAYEHPAYDQWSGQPQQADPQGYDLAAYGAQNQQHAYAAGYQAQPAGSQPARAPAEWGQQQYAQPAFDPYQQGNGQLQPGQQQDYALNAGQPDPRQAAAYDQGYAGDEAGEIMEDEAPRGRRGFLIAATLAGAIIVGGGLTYAYNSLLGSGSGGPPPLVKSAAGPSKVKPSEPGGKQFDHADSKVLGRLNDNGTAGEIDASGSKKVSTLVVKPDGTIEPPAMTEPAGSASTAEPATANPAPVVAAVPGLSVVSVGGEVPVAAATAAEKAGTQVVAEATKPVQAAAGAAQKPLVVTPPAAPKTPTVISSAATSAANAPAAASSVVETAAVEPGAVAAPAAKKPAPVKKVATAAPAAAATGTTAPAAVSTGTAGYMAVVASVPASAKSRMDALTQWADMQQKYGSILQGKTMDVQEAKVADKGTYHRLLVGPPSSKDSASTICSQLKAAGHGDCWVMGY